VPRETAHGTARQKNAVNATGILAQDVRAERLCHDVTQRLDDFRHVRIDEMAITFAQARRRVPHGLQAKLTPMRFEDGSLLTRRGGRAWTLERLYDGDREMLYILTFYLPRFLDHSFREKLITVFHKLYHISPKFNGDIRRMNGRYHVHTHSQCEYDRAMGTLVSEYLRRSPPAECVDFLRHDFRGLCARYGAVLGKRIAAPKLIEIPSAKSA
jgi:predicted metallopeptidase